MISLLRASLLARERAHNRRFEAAAADPRASQARLLLALTRRNAATAFGQEHGFATIESPNDFAHRVPVRDFEGLRPYVARIIEGEHGVLTADPVTMFTTTSGTTAEPKLIPTTDGWREEMAALMRLWMYRALSAHPRYLDHKVLLVVGPAIEGHTPRGIPFGSLSGVTYQRIPRLVRRSYAVPYEVTLLEDPEARYFLTMRFALASSVSALGTPNPTTLLRLGETAIERGDDIVRAIHDGTLGIGGDQLVDAGGESLATRLSGTVAPDPKRARFLDGVVHEHGGLLPGACWPGLELIGCWLGGSAGLHAERLGRFFGSHPALRDLGLLASEGRMTVPIEDATPGGPLALHANYYEFIPEDDGDSSSPTTLGAHELELGRRYYIVLTGRNGLYRYDINDIVEVVGYHRATAKVAFVRKGRDMVSITGEKVHLDQVQAALLDATRVAALDFRVFRLIPDEHACHHHLLVEFEDAPPSDSRLTDLVASFDRNLREMNREYRSKRESKRLGPPTLFAMKAGWSEEMCRRDFRLGRRESQHKWQAMGVPWDDETRSAVTTQADMIS